MWQLDFNLWQLHSEVMRSSDEAAGLPLTLHWLSAPLSWYPVWCEIFDWNNQDKCCHLASSEVSSFAKHSLRTRQFLVGETHQHPWVQEGHMPQTSASTHHWPMHRPVTLAHHRILQLPGKCWFKLNWAEANQMHGLRYIALQHVPFLWGSVWLAQDRSKTLVSLCQ